MEKFDCAIIGAGPAGLSASLTLGRARKKVLLFDNGTNRNRVTHESHGFLTRDGITPASFKEISLLDLKKYPAVYYQERTVSKITRRLDGLFIISTLEHIEYVAKKIILATGVQEIFPSIPHIKEYYGKSLFSCPYCDGWELQDRPLIAIAEKEEHAIHIGKLVSNWSQDLIIATNGYELTHSTVEEFHRKNIVVKTEPIQGLHGEGGYLKSVTFESGDEIEREAGFIVPSFHRSNQFAEQLDCEIKENGAIVIDNFGRTTQEHIYVAGESAKNGPASVIIAAADGSKVAATVNMDLINEKFEI